MTGIDPTSVLGANAAPVRETREDLRAVAQQFEAVLLRQMLASSRNVDFGGNDLFGQSDDTFREMRDARFAEVTAQSGQLGFAAQIERQLAHFLPADEA